MINRTSIALNMIVRMLEWFEKYTGLTFPMQKLGQSRFLGEQNTQYLNFTDHMAMYGRHMSAGNLGLITNREGDLTVVDERNNLDKNYAALYMGYLIAHQVYN